MVSQIYPSELQLNKANASDTEAAFLDLHLSISIDIVSTEMYDKRDDFDFEIVNFPFLDGDSKFQVGLKSLLRQGLSEPDFYGDLVYKLKKIVGSNNFSAQFIRIIFHYKKIGYNINELQQTACMVVNPITVGNLLSSLIARRWVGLQTL